MRILLILVVVLSFYPSFLYAQVESPISDEVFTEDTGANQERQKKFVKEIMKTDPAASNDLKFQSPKVEYLDERDMIQGSDGVVVSYEGMQVQADTGRVNLSSKDAEFEGGILMTSPEGVLSADTGTYNLDSEIGSFSDATFSMDEGAYQFEAKTLAKVSETEYELKDTRFSTCHCNDGSFPWCLNSSEVNVEEEGYAHTYNTVLKLWDIPAFYTPWLAFPVKRERASGLLVPEWGYSGTDGIRLKLPLFLVLDDYTDATVTPFIETKTRNGAQLDFRKAFSKYSNWNSRFIYSNERPRDGNLRGTVITGLDDPTFDEDRFGGFIKQGWRTSSDSDLDLGIVTDIHYVSDDLFLREIEDEEIGRRNAQYTVSSIMLRSGLGDYSSMELRGEYNQAMQTNDDLVFQRLPELTLSGSRRLRPFGFNPFGLKLVTKGEINVVDFVRKDGFDGWRTDINPSLKIPAHIKNYANMELELSAHQTYYNLDERVNPGDGVLLEDGKDRFVPRINYKVGTDLERVYDVDDDSWLVTLSSLGAQNQGSRLKRIKHTVTPNVSFGYVPDVEQDDLPLFDSLDRIRARNLFTYGIESAFYGRFDLLRGTGNDLVELSPRVKDLPLIPTDQTLSDIGQSQSFGVLGQEVFNRKKYIRKLADFKIIQSYDYREDKKDIDPNLSPFSDVGFDFGLYPSSSFGFSFQSNYDAENSEFSSWKIATHFKDDRDDILRIRYTFIDDSLSQLESNLEIKLTERLRFGAYARYDDETQEFIEDRLALRLRSACDCWYVDLSFVDRINPDKEQVVLTFNFEGLGSIAQKFGVYEPEDQ